MTISSALLQFHRRAATRTLSVCFAYGSFNQLSGVGSSVGIALELFNTSETASKSFLHIQVNLSFSDEAACRKVGIRQSILPAILRHLNACVLDSMSSPCEAHCRLQRRTTHEALTDKSALLCLRSCNVSYALPVVSDVGGQLLGNLYV